MLKILTVSHIFYWTRGTLAPLSFFLREGESEPGISPCPVEDVGNAQLKIRWKDKRATHFWKRSVLFNYKEIGFVTIHCDYKSASHGAPTGAKFL